MTMDYAIYKTNDGRNARAVHIFKQEECNHRAKNAARQKLHDMWLHVLQCNKCCCNPSGDKDAFEYDHMTSANTTERIRFYVAQFK